MISKSVRLTEAAPRYFLESVAVEDDEEDVSAGLDSDFDSDLVSDFDSEDPGLLEPDDPFPFA